MSRDPDDFASFVDSSRSHSGHDGRGEASNEKKHCGEPGDDGVGCDHLCVDMLLAYIPQKPRNDAEYNGEAAEAARQRK